MNEDESLFRGDFVGERFGVANGFAFQDDARAKIPRPNDLGKGRALRHDNCRRKAQTLRVLGDALRVVAGRDGDDAFAALARNRL